MIRPHLLTMMPQPRSSSYTRHCGKGGAWCYNVAMSLREKDGRQLALAMIRELAQQWAQQDLEGVPDDQIREVMLNREPDILRKYLATVREHPELERGFLCVVTDFLGGESQIFPDEFIERRVVQ